MEHFRSIKAKHDILKSYGIDATPFSAYKKCPKGATWEEAHNSPYKPGDNIGFICKKANISVIDIDREDGSPEALIEVAKLHEAFVNTFPDDFINAPSEKSPTGGYHFFFKWQEGDFDETGSKMLTLMDDSGMEIKKLDIDTRTPCHKSKSNGGAIVIAPSKYTGDTSEKKLAPWKDNYKGKLYEEQNPFNGDNLSRMSEELQKLFTVGKCKFIELDGEIFIETVEIAPDPVAVQKKQVEKGEGLARNEQCMIEICDKLSNYPALYADNDGWQKIIQALISAFACNVDQDTFIEICQGSMDPTGDYETENTKRIESYYSKRIGDGVGSLVNILKSVLGEEFNAFMSLLNNKGLWDLPKRLKSQFNFEVVEDIIKLQKRNECSITDVINYLSSCIRYSINAGKPMYAVRSREIDGNITWTMRSCNEFEPYCRKVKLAIAFEETVEGEEEPKKTVKKFSLERVMEIPSVLASISVSRISFIPYPPGGTPEHNDKILNMYNGIKAQNYTPDPMYLGNPHEYVELFKSHIHNIWCKKNKDLSDHVIKWFAHIIQKPHIKTKVALVVVGQEGSGKSIIPNEIMRLKLLGEDVSHHYESIARYTERFETKKEKLLLAILNEANTTGMSKSDRELLKHRIADDNTDIEYKGVSKYSTKLYNNIIITTNNYVGLMIGNNDRHYIVLDTSSERVDDSEYFDKLANPDHEELTALYQYLLTLDLTGYIPNKKIKTEAKHEMAMNQLSAVQRIFLKWSTKDLMTALNIDIKNNQYVFSANGIYRYYTDVFAKDEQIRKVIGSNTFKRDLADMFGKQTRMSNEDRSLVYKLSFIDMISKIRKCIGEEMFDHFDTGNRPFNPKADSRVKDNEYDLPEDDGGRDNMNNNIETSMFEDL